MSDWRPSPVERYLHDLHERFRGAASPAGSWRCCPDSSAFRRLQAAAPAVASRVLENLLLSTSNIVERLSQTASHAV